MGFLSSFESIRGKIDNILDQVMMMNRESGENKEAPTILLTGHSMGGALAQIAAAYYADLSPRLVTHLPELYIYTPYISST